MAIAGQTFRSSFPSSKAPDRTVTVISIQINNLRLEERRLAQGHKAWDHSARYKSHPHPGGEVGRLLPPPGCGSEGRNLAGKGSSAAPEPGRPPPELKRGPKATAGRAAGTPRGQGLPLLGQRRRPPVPTRRCAGEGEAQGAGREVHLRRCPSEGGGTGRLAMKLEGPPPGPGKGNQLPGPELCSPPPEPEAAPIPEAGSGGGPGFERRISLGLGGAPQLHGLSGPWPLGLLQSPVLPTVRSFSASGMAFVLLSPSLPNKMERG